MSMTDMVQAIETEDEENPLLREALAAANRGWKVVPLHWAVKKGVCSCHNEGKCPFPGKHPHGKKWQENATSDPAVLKKFWKSHPKANVGVLCGEASGFVDFETDDEQQEAQYAALFDGEPPLAPTYASSRGKHHIFRWREGLPPGAVTKVGELCVRIGNDGRGAMSVIPPSTHPSGVQYTWILHPDDCTIPEIPNAVVAKLWNQVAAGPAEGNGKPPEHWVEVSKGVVAGKRNETAAGFSGKVLSTIDVFDNTVVSLQWEMLVGWNMRNKPPLDEKELHTTFESILQRERTKRTNNAHEAAFTRNVARDPDSGRVITEGWRLVIVKNEPRRYKLFSPCWAGYIDIGVKEYLIAEAVRTAVLEQKDTWLPPSFRKVWLGDKKNPSLAAQLVGSAIFEDEGEEAKRSWVIASRLYMALTSHTKHIGKDEELDYRGIPCVLDDGSYVFSFDDISTVLSRSEDRIKRPEMSRLVKTLGGHRVTPRIAGTPTARTRIKRDGMRQLQRIVTGDGPTFPQPEEKPATDDKEVLQ